MVAAGIDSGERLDCCRRLVAVVVIILDEHAMTGVLAEHAA
jgi:hypothetical protein